MTLLGIVLVVIGVCTGVGGLVLAGAIFIGLEAVICIFS